MRSLECIHQNHRHFLEAGGIRKKVNNFLNCVTEPIFDIPITQVHAYLCLLLHENLSCNITFNTRYAYLGSI